MIHHGNTETRSDWQKMQLLGLIPILCAVTLFSWAQQATHRHSPIQVRKLVDDGTKEANQLIVVHGCLVKEFEIRVLQPCDAKFDQFSKYSVWLDDIQQVTEQGKETKESSLIPAQSAEVLKNGRGNLWQLNGSRDQPHTITVEGEFQVSWRRKFGHLNFYKSRFIVHRLFEATDAEK